MMNPIEQFEIHELFPIVKIGNFEIAFTNSAAYMLAAVALVTIFLLGATGRKAWFLRGSNRQQRYPTNLLAK
jgi:F-type H+-transporting ATPase subunit a